MNTLRRIIISAISLCMTIGLVTANTKVYAIGNEIDSSLLYEKAEADASIKIGQVKFLS